MRPGYTRLQPGCTRLQRRVSASSPLRLQVLPASLELPESIVDEVTKERFAATLADQRQVSSEHHLTS